MALREISESCVETHSLDHHSVLCPPVASVCCIEIASCCTVNFYSLEQRIFLLLKFYRLNQSIFLTMQSFQRKFNVTKGQKRDALEALFEKFQWTGNLMVIWCARVRLLQMRML